MSAGCEHGYYAEEVVEDEDWDGNITLDYIRTWKSSYEDIDLHRYRCRECGIIGYYSSRAQAHYERGEDFDR